MQKTVGVDRNANNKGNNDMKITEYKSKDEDKNNGIPR